MINFNEYGELLLSGILNTLLLAIIGTFLGLIFALFIGTLASLKEVDIDNKINNIIKKIGIGLSKTYISIFRGTPMMVQALIFWSAFALIFGGKSWIVQRPLLIGIMVISLNTAAYVGEVIRGAIINLEKGQLEASRSLGMSLPSSLINIILPQATRNSIPAIGNELIINIKDSCVLNVIAVTELFYVGNRISGKTYDKLNTFIVIAIIYFVLTFCATQLLYYINKRTSVNYVRKTRRSH